MLADGSGTEHEKDGHPAREAGFRLQKSFWLLSAYSISQCLPGLREYLFTLYTFENAARMFRGVCQQSD